MNKMERARIINRLRDNLVCDRPRYLEIGVSQGTTFERVDIEDKRGVDPNPQYRSVNIHEQTSDEFFKDCNDEFDIVFIDGQHHAEQVLRDFENSLRSLSIPGFIVIDDICPLNEVEQQRQELPPGNPWTGDVWKFVYFLIQRYPYLRYTVHHDPEPGFRSCLSVYIDSPIRLDLDRFDHERYTYARHYPRYMRRLEGVVYKPRHVFLVTSKTHDAHLSLYPHQERFKQLKQTIDSIRRNHHGSRIVVLEGSLLNQELEDALYDCGVSSVHYYPNDFHKSLGETFMLHAFCSVHAHYLSTQADFVHKISGRYYMTAGGRVNFGKAVFKKQISWKTSPDPVSYYETIYYNFPSSFIHDFVAKLGNILTNHSRMFSGNDDIEHVFYSHDIFPPNKIQTPPFMNIEGLIATTMKLKQF